MWQWPTAHGCPQELAAAAAAQTAAVSQRRSQAEIDRCRSLTMAGLSGILESYTFDRYIRRVDWPESDRIKVQVQAYANAVLSASLNGKPWLILHGEYGTGKSHLSAAVVRALLDANWRGCYFRVWPRYINRLHATMDKSRDVDDDFGRETQADILAELTRGALVVIDDIDKQPATDWTRAKMFDVLNTRYNALAPTILTFNTHIFDPAIENFIGRAVLDRLMQHAYNIIEFAGPSYRLAN